MTPDEFIAFIELWRPQMLKYFGSKGPWQDAEDLTQDLFAALSQHPADLRLATAKRYMWVAALHIAMNSQLRNVRMPLTYDPVPDFRTPYRARQLTWVVEQQAATKDEDQATVDRDDLKGELKILTPRQRSIITQTVLGSHTMVELAHMAGISSSAVRQARERGLTRLRVARLNAHKE